MYRTNAVLAGDTPELTDVFGNGIDVVPNSTNFPVPVLISY